MKIEKIKIKNFRSLKNFCIDLEDELSLIVGKKQYWQNISYRNIK